MQGLAGALVVHAFHVRYNYKPLQARAQRKQSATRLSMARNPVFSTDYWSSLQITSQDVEFLHNHLFENETPLTSKELVAVLIPERVRLERAALEAKHNS